MEDLSCLRSIVRLETLVANHRDLIIHVLLCELNALEPEIRALTLTLRLGS
jgi:hypothetical protein